MEDWRRTAEREASSQYSVYIIFRHLLMHETHPAYGIDDRALEFFR